MRQTYLPELRENYDKTTFEGLRRGNFKDLAKKLSVSRPTISRMVNEIRILEFFPSLNKSKAEPLSRLKTKRDLFLFSQKNDIFNLSTRKITNLVKKWNKSLEKNPHIIVNDLEHDLIIGSTLGDANIRQRNRNCMFRVGHTLKQKKYLEWKISVLKEFKTKGVTFNQRKINNRALDIYNFDLNTHYVFNFYRKLFYNKKGRKIITKDLLKQINQRSLAFWLCDDGSYCKKQKYIILCTNAFSLKEHKLLKNFFKKEFNLNPTIGFRDNKYHYLRFKKDDTAKFVEMVKPFLPLSMHYKVGG